MTNEGIRTPASLDFEVTTELGTAKVRSAWIVRVDEDFARLLTCYVL